MKQVRAEPQQKRWLPKLLRYSSPPKFGLAGADPPLFSGRSFGVSEERARPGLLGPRGMKGTRARVMARRAFSFLVAFGKSSSHHQLLSGRKDNGASRGRYDAGR